MFKFNKHIRNVLISFLPLAVVITALCGLIYVTLHQNYRQTANDPQIQLAEDVIKEIEGGQDSTAFIPTRKLDLASTLATYIMVFDDKGKLLGTSVTLDGKDPVVPSGVFDVTKQKGETRFTWEPKKGVRNALVVKYYKGNISGFIGVGRSLREVEKREFMLAKTVALGWILTLGASFLSLLYFSKVK